VPLAIAVPPRSLVGLYLIGGRFRAHGMSLLRAAPTSVLDNGLSKSLFRKIAQIASAARFQTNQVPNNDMTIFQFLIPTFSRSDVRVSMNCLPEEENVSNSTNGGRPAHAVAAAALARLDNVFSFPRGSYRHPHQLDLSPMGLLFP